MPLLNKAAFLILSFLFVQLCQAVGAHCDQLFSGTGNKTKRVWQFHYFQQAIQHSKMQIPI
jgi:hypothetical protein